ncbi:MAG: acyl-CoA dehydrogenase [Gammaproteobacteria bacterium]|nr:acyl-CoA dehydrogenase [Gammaproteobacteria bacterium]NIR84894.1 acyl-CoA dehydrogenase [Gammaproteobacteria bacterium]NIR91743.1 acyl-CoA dehydrogenase [Gammaproteobacteria bacterium]NIU05941.1 acyl-CoA dehydrogenase [Gammaproteobacteria bacterium]NIV52988.1 acyl-CoA dehydrogenase [Gammaproteobacteria bacterium]
MMEEGKFQELLRAVERLVEEQLIPNEERVAEEDAIPAEIVAALKELGLFGMSIPKAYGGLGLSMAQEVEVALRLGEASPAYRSLVGTNNGLGSQGIVTEGTDVQRRTWLPRLAAGEVITAFALSEPEAGSDAAAVRTSARREGDAYVLDGTKSYVTNAPEAGLFTVLARTGAATEGKARGISAFLVEAATPGLRLGDPDRKMGLHGSHSSEVILQECRVPASALLGGREGTGFKTAMRLLDRQRLHISAVCTGMAERLVRESVSHALTRRQFDQPIAEFQLVQAMLADSRTEVYAARCMVRDAARRHDAAESVTVEAACCKLFGAEMVKRVADRAVQVHGGKGYITGTAAERFYRDARLFSLFEGTSQIQQIVIARNLMREAAGG